MCLCFLNRHNRYLGFSKCLILMAFLGAKVNVYGATVNIYGVKSEYLWGDGESLWGAEVKGYGAVSE